MQTTNSAEQLINDLKPLLKAQGFKKSNATWRKEQGESVAVFNVQKSSWGGDKYYINIGTYFRTLGSDESPTENKCHIRLRLDVGDPSNVVSQATKWFRERALLKDAVLLADADSKKGLVARAVRSALTL